MFCMLGGIFEFRWLSYSAAGRWVLKSGEFPGGSICWKAANGGAKRIVRFCRAVPSAGLSCH